MLIILRPSCAFTSRLYNYVRRLVIFRISKMAMASSIEAEIIDCFNKTRKKNWWLNSLLVFSSLWTAVRSPQEKLQMSQIIVCSHKLSIHKTISVSHHLTWQAKTKNIYLDCILLRSVVDELEFDFQFPVIERLSRCTKKVSYRP